MQTKLFFIRKIKGLALKFGVHKAIEPINDILLNMSYLSKFSKWKSEHSEVEFNDFYREEFGSNMRFELYKHIIKAEDLNQPINYLEFGVAFGRSFKWWAQNNTNTESKFVGFDTFTGLPEDWNLFNKGDMSADGKTPEINDERCSFEVGLFQETLPSFIKKFDFSKRNVIHIDADLYTSTLYVLTSLAPFMKKDDIIVFDEFGVPQHEFKAFTEFCNSYYIDYKVIAAVNNYFQIAVKILS
jgi:O-methyltransferase